jgi:hypothetical protein
MKLHDLTESSAVFDDVYADMQICLKGINKISKAPYHLHGNASNLIMIDPVNRDDWTTEGYPQLVNVFHAGGSAVLVARNLRDKTHMTAMASLSEAYSLMLELIKEANARRADQD